jgi:hypothetical protein
MRLGSFSPAIMASSVSSHIRLGQDKAQELQRIADQAKGTQPENNEESTILGRIASAAEALSHADKFESSAKGHPDQVELTSEDLAKATDLSYLNTLKPKA